MYQLLQKKVHDGYLKALSTMKKINKLLPKPNSALMIKVKNALLLERISFGCLNIIRISI